jgi:hypothetical protein
LIRFGTVGNIKEIENEICKLPNDLLYDGSEPLIEFKGSKPKTNFKIQAFIKWYEIFENEQAKQRTLDWLKTNQVYVKYHYDKRINEASIEISDESLIHLSRRLPRLKLMIDYNTTWQKKVRTEPN